MTRSRVNDGWVATDGLLQRLAIILYHLTFEGPRAQEVREVGKCLETINATYNLRRVDTTEKRIRLIILILGRNIKAYHGLVDDSIVLQRLQVMQMASLIVLLR